ncbi:MAG: protein kinase domain-containing protein [Planctomycetota bacterium]
MLPADEWAVFLARECPDDPALVQEVLELLRRRPPTDFIEPPLIKLADEPSADQLASGRSVGPFRIIRTLGRGATGVVYVAHDEKLDRAVALKVLSSSGRNTEAVIERFRREARAASALAHPNIISVLMWGEDEGMHWFAMPLVDGHDLHEELVRQRKLQDREAGATTLLPPFSSPEYVTAVVSCLADLAEAVQCAHDHGIVHRDIKPHNVLLDRMQRPYLADFGIARDERLGRMTRTDVIQGTLHYMSPEQAHVLRQRVDHRTDVYSLSVVLYELLCLEPAFEGDTQREILHKIALEEPRALRKLNPRVARDLAVICAKGMSKRPSHRYASARDFADDLRRFLRHEAIVARPPSALERAWRVAIARRGSVIGTAAVVMAIAVGWTLAERRSRQGALARHKAVFSTLTELGEDDWRERTSELVDARARRKDLASAGELPAELEELLGLFDEQLARFKSAALARGLSLRELGFGVEVESYVRPVSETALAQSVVALTEAATVFSDDPALVYEADIRRTFPRVTLRLSSATLASTPLWRNAVAFFSPIDPIRGGPIERGKVQRMPVESAALPRGEYRIVVEIEGYGFAELIRDLVPRAKPYEFVVHVRPDAEVHAGMKRIEAGYFPFRKSSPLGCSYVDDGVDLPEFWIDEAEVSNREYLQFVVQTGHLPPARWLEAGFDGDWPRMTEADWWHMPLQDVAECWLDLPVAGIEWNDAVAFAEWAGKRLPTHFELERALRGPEALLYPWEGAAPGVGGGLANVGGERRRWSDQYEAFQLYLQSVLPVRQPGYRQRPEGLFHAYGNVAEFTESVMVQPYGRVLEFSTRERAYLGGAWDAGSRPDDNLSSHPYWGAGPAYVTDFIGIRCAKSGSSMQ